MSFYGAIALPSKKDWLERQSIINQLTVAAGLSQSKGVF
jgi:hypothetical protein